MSKHAQTHYAAAAMACVLSAVAFMLPRSVQAAPPLSYAQLVRPILQANCLECHQPGGIGYQRSGLNMRTYASLMKGTKYGRVIIPGDSFDSVLVELIEHRANPTINMPFHKNRLSNTDIAKISAWIDGGAKP